MAAPVPVVIGTPSVISIGPSSVGSVETVRPPARAPVSLSSGSARGGPSAPISIVSGSRASPTSPSGVLGPRAPNSIFDDYTKAAHANSNILLCPAAGSDLPSIA